jgi:hypothetical protein
MSDGKKGTHPIEHSIYFFDENAPHASNPIHHPRGHAHIAAFVSHDSWFSVSLTRKGDTHLHKLFVFDKDISTVLWLLTLHLHFHVSSDR